MEFIFFFYFTHLFFFLPFDQGVWRRPTRCQPWASSRGHTQSWWLSGFPSPVWTAAGISGTPRQTVKNSTSFVESFMTDTHDSHCAFVSNWISVWKNAKESCNVYSAWQRWEVYSSAVWGSLWCCNMSCGHKVHRTKAENSHIEHTGCIIVTVCLS